MKRSGRKSEPRLVQSGLRAFATMAAFGVGIVSMSGAARADAVTTWNEELLSVIRQTSALLVDGPPEVARQIAIVGTAMSDAVNAATGGKYTPYAYSGGPVSGVSAEAAALAAGYTAMRSIFENAIWQTSGFYTPPSGPVVPYSNPNLINNTILPHIDTVYNNAIAALGGGSAVTDGQTLGIAAATDVINARANDGAIAAITYGLNANMPPGSGAGVYVPPTGRPEMFPTWGSVTPFGASGGVNGSQYTTSFNNIRSNVAEPLSLTGADYANDVLRTQCVGGRIAIAPLSGATQSVCDAAGYTQATNDQVQAALFWNDPGGTIQPPGHWLQIVTTVANAENLSLLDKARLTSLVGMGMTDAGIQAWDTKYDYNLWRPITAIRDCSNWNSNFTTCQSDWQSEIATPPHPDYVAGHPAFSGAAATILEGYLGVDKVNFCSTSDPYTNGNLGPVGNITICFDSFSAASSGPQGSTESRVYGGIHTQAAVDQAEIIGNSIGAALLSSFNVEAIPEPATIAVLGLSLAALVGAKRRRNGAALATV